MGIAELASSPALGGLIAFAAAFRAGAAIAQTDQPRLPSIDSATYQHVGVTYSRCGGARVKTFYPAAAPSRQVAKPTSSIGVAHGAAQTEFEPPSGFVEGPRSHTVARVQGAGM